jgi:hypothetical protein
VQLRNRRGPSAGDNKLATQIVLDFARVVELLAQPFDLEFSLVKRTARMGESGDLFRELRFFVGERALSFVQLLRGALLISQYLVAPLSEAKRPPQASAAAAANDPSATLEFSEMATGPPLVSQNRTGIAVKFDEI